MKKTSKVLYPFLLFFLAAAAVLLVFGTSVSATDYPWMSWRHDLQNTGAAPDSGYPVKAEITWEQVRESEEPYKTPARCSTPVVTGGDLIIFTGHGGRVEARNQHTGELVWTKMYTWIDLPPNPSDAPKDWCQGSTPNINTNTGVCGYTIDGKCPDWCYACADTPNDCSGTVMSNGGSLISPLHFPKDFGVFCTAATIDLDEAGGKDGRVYFGTMDGRYFCLNLQTGQEIWQREPWKEKGGPNEGRPWYDQKFAWNLSPASIHEDKMFFGTFLPSFYWVFKAMPFVLNTQGDSVPAWPSFEKNFKQFWVGRDGWSYCLDKMSGDIKWGWDPGGCGVTNIPPVAGGLVFFNADTVIDYHYGQMAACDINTGEKVWHVGPVPMAQGGNPAISVARNTIFWPEGDGAIWATDLTTKVPGPHGDTGHVKWTYHAGFQPYGATGVASSVALDEKRGWIISASDTGHLFVLDMNTGKVIRRTYMGVPDWKPENGQPDSGFYFPGASAPTIVPAQGLVYIAGTDFESAWQGSSSLGKEKLFCYDYASPGPTLKLVWEYQFLGDNGEEHIIKGHDPYQVSFYSLSTPALTDGHVYYGSYNGKAYCFGKEFDNATACPAALALSDAPGKVQALRGFRDKVLYTTPRGLGYIRLFQKHARELTELLLKHPDLKAEARSVLEIMVSRLGSSTEAAPGSLLQELFDLSGKLQDTVADKASPELVRDMEKVALDFTADRAL